MLRQFTPLQSVSLASFGNCTLSQQTSNRVTADSPAIDVMTDLTRVAAVTIDGAASLDAANDFMKARGVRSLFVMTHDGKVSGLITATDILGERPLRIGQTHGVKRSELRVTDVMTPISAVEAVKYEDVMSAKVGHVVASLQHSGRHHALVLQTLLNGEARIRGIFSATEVARQLGVAIQITERARTFAEVEQVLAAPQ
jgi:CBS-domain-containing membrane protein